MILALTVACSPGGTNPNAVVREADDGCQYRGTCLDTAYEMPDKTLTDTSGGDYNLVSTPSKPVTLIFFGYTNCPDICIGVLSDLALALQRVDGQTRDNIQVVFITTDPARDDAKTIKKYLARFDPSFIGLTGDLSKIKAVAERMAVAIESGEKLESGGYDINHSAQVIAFGKDSTAPVLWTPSTPIGDLAHDFDLLVANQT